MRRTLYKWVIISSAFLIGSQPELYLIKEPEKEIAYEVQDGYKQISMFDIIAEAQKRWKPKEPEVEKPVEPEPPLPEEAPKRVLTMEATAYTLSVAECGNTKGITRTGTHVKEGRTLSVDPKVIPLGSLLHIESDYAGITGDYVAEDTGSAIKGKKLDVYFGAGEKAYKSALKFGKRKVTVTVIREGYE